MVVTPLVQTRPAGGAGGGVTDHGALTGLGDDDHTQYALAAKTRPSPWVAVGDLAARSLADLGTRDHHLTTGLSDDDHAQYALLAGRAAGQTIIGDTASGGHLTLQSTSHATRGYVRAQDDLQLLSGYIRASDGTQLIRILPTSPNVSIYGNLLVTDMAAIGNTAAVASMTPLYVKASLPAEIVYGAYIGMTGNMPAEWEGYQTIYGILGGAYSGGAPLGVTAIYGLYFVAQHSAPAPATAIGGIYVQQASSGDGAITTARAIYLPAASWGGAKPTTTYGIHVAQQGASGVTTAYGIRIADQTATTVRLLEVGTTPYLRLVGGAAPAANCTHLWLAEGVIPTLRNLQWKLYSALVAGDRVAVLV